MLHIHVEFSSSPMPHLPHFCFQSPSTCHRNSSVHTNPTHHPDPDPTSSSIDLCCSSWRPHSHSMHVCSLRRCFARAPRPSVPETWWTNGWSLGILIWMCSLVTIGTPSKIKENNFEFQCDVMMSASWKPWHWEVHCLGNLRSPRTIEMATPTTHWFAKKMVAQLDRSKKNASLAADRRQNRRRRIRNRISNWISGGVV